ncbi:MAG: KamA family radical SAM protein, partial [Polyangiaceae bacterium]|nr:KamA family radical SAM protein [Polyangiaceae bacterium]
MASSCASTNWRWQLRHAVRSGEVLGASLRLTPDERRGLAQAAAGGLSLLIPPYYLALCDPDDPSCPIRRQCVPHGDEAVRVPGDLHDPLGEVGHEVLPGLVRRYPDRALLIVSAACAVHCRFCTRSRVTRDRRGVALWSQLDPALQWLREHPDVRELLLSGGDPLVASTRRIRELLMRVRAVPSIEVIRIGTRVPAVLPMRIEPELVDVLRAHGPIWIMTHFNHPRELTPQACQALSLLADGGLPVMNQTVLLRGVNDNTRVLSELCRGLV